MIKPNTRCKHCQIGRFQPVTAPYLEMVDGQMMAVANMPAHRCDVCGFLEYDAAHLGRLQYLIDHPAPEYDIKLRQNKRPFVPESQLPLSSR